jgi:hypothetical protein
MPRHLAKVRAGISQHQEEIEQAVADAGELLEDEPSPEDAPPHEDTGGRP